MVHDGPLVFTISILILTVGWNKCIDIIIDFKHSINCNFTLCFICPILSAAPKHTLSLVLLSLRRKNENLCIFFILIIPDKIKTCEWQKKISYFRIRCHQKRISNTPHLNVSLTTRLLDKKKIMNKIF
jgi:hypothetical protein